MVTAPAGGKGHTMKHNYTENMLVENQVDTISSVNTEPTKSLSTALPLQCCCVSERKLVSSFHLFFRMVNIPGLNRG